MANSEFINRTYEKPKPNYIEEANEQIKKNGTIDPESPTYKDALDQYNAGLIKGSVERLEVPEGYCGYIDPNTGEFRVEPDPIASDLKSSTLYPDNIVDPEDVPDAVITPYPIDCQLRAGLPGSYEYTQSDPACDVEDGDNACSGVAWFSGGGTGTETGTEALSQTICGGGPGINSNTGVAASSPIGGVGADGSYPPELLEYANGVALSWNWSAGYAQYAVANKVGTLIYYDFFYDVDDPPGSFGPEFHKESGLRVRVGWDTEISAILEGSEFVTEMWLYEPPK